MRSGTSALSPPSFHLIPSPTILQPPLSRLPPSPSSRQIQQAHAHLVHLGLSAHRSTLARLLSLCGAVPSPSSSSSSSSTSPLLHYYLSLYSSIHRPNVFAANNLIRCLARSSSPRQSLLFYSQMRRTAVPTNNYTYPFVLHACSRDALSAEGKQIHAHVARFGLDRDLYVRNALISFYSACSDMGESRKVFDDCPLARDVVSWNALVIGYARAGEICTAEKVFDEMSERDVISWSSMIVGYVQNGMLEKGIGLFREMVGRGLAVNEAALVTVLSASAQLGLLECGRFVHSTIEDLKFPMTLAVGTALVDMYAKCGCIEASRRVFEGLPKRDIFAWNAMVCGLAVHGLGKEALMLFQRFIEEGLRPNGVTFVGVLNACSRAGFVEEGRGHFKSMVQDYGIEPEMEHYGCMVDLLGRAGLVSEAVELIEGMCIPTDPVLWGTLLGACKMHGLVDMGVSIGNKLLELDPAHDGHYVLLAGIYAKARRWEDVAKVRRLMSSHGTSKIAGWSLIDADGTVHKFVAGDREHKQSSDIYTTLEMIGNRLVDVGYLPDVSPVLHDIGDEEKIHAIKEHSERLAIAFGLMVTKAGEPIRIVKNLRVCWDCHEFSKMVAKVFDREIIVRDGSRFHHFKVGTCSCLDYW